MNREHESGSPGGGLEPQGQLAYEWGFPRPRSHSEAAFSVFCPPSPPQASATPRGQPPPRRHLLRSPPPLRPRRPAAPPLQPSSNPVPRARLTPPPASQDCRLIGRNGAQGAWPSIGGRRDVGRRDLANGVGGQGRGGVGAAPG